MANSETEPVLVDAKDDEDRQVDAWAVLVIFAALVLGAVHFVSGWTFDLHL